MTFDLNKKHNIVNATRHLSNEQVEKLNKRTIDDTIISTSATAITFGVVGIIVADEGFKRAEMNKKPVELDRLAKL